MLLEGIYNPHFVALIIRPIEEKTLSENSVVQEMEILHVFRLQSAWIYNLDICTFSVSLADRREKIKTN